MSREPVEGVGVLVVRVWHDDTDASSFRARLTIGRDTAGDSTVTLASNPDEVVAVVKKWLASLAP